MEIHSPKGPPEVWLHYHAVTVLAAGFGYAAFFAPPPWNVKLNQWRNIAQHFSARVEGVEILCVYGKGRNKRELRLTRPELLNAVGVIYAAVRALKTARTIFVLNNLERIGLDPSGLRLRDDVKVLHLGSALAAQGFELVRLEVTPECVEAAVRDLANEISKTRMIHSSQFLYPIWCEFPHARIAVSYLDNCGTLMLTSTIQGTACEEIANGKVPFEELARRVDFLLTDAGRSLFPCR